MQKLFLHAAEQIRSWVVTENFRPGTPLPSGQALGAQFKLRHTTTFRACQLLVAEGFLQRKGYRLLVAPEKSTGPLLGTVQIISYSEEFSRSAVRILAERNVLHKLVALSWSKHPKLEPILRKVLAENPAGILVWAAKIGDEAQSLLQNAPVPLVFCADTADQLERSAAQLDIYRGTSKAIRHLYKLGHRRIAHFSVGHQPADRELTACYRAACLELDLPASSLVIWQAESLKEEVIRERMLAGRKRHPEVTALFAHDHAACCATRIFDVPTELSVIGIYGLPAGLESRPPLTTVTLRDPDAIALWACADLISQIQTLASGRPPKPATKAFLVPDLILRKSTQPLSGVAVTPEPPRSPSLPAPDPHQTWRKSYPFLAESGSDHWLQLDLSKLANHSMTRRNGWLGAEPLEYFPPGLRSIHGVPFLVVDEERNEGSSVVTFRSPHTHSTGEKQLPTRAVVRIASRVRALYFLHGCAHAIPTPFAKYTMHFQAGGSATVPLVPLGPSRQWILDRGENVKVNLQDWWAGFEQDDFPHAYHATVFNPADTTIYERTLYSLEWINPRPDDEIKQIEVRVDPNAGPVLALIAITALL